MQQIIFPPHLHKIELIVDGTMMKCRTKNAEQKTPNKNAERKRRTKKTPNEKNAKRKKRRTKKHRMH
jgi:hypothetical protein